MEVQTGGQAMTDRPKMQFHEFLCGIRFALCFFIFMMTESFINERCSVILGGSAVNLIYTFGLICTGAGFLSFPLFRKICKTEKVRKATLIIISVLYLASAVILLFANRPVIFLTASAAALLMIGHIGSDVYCCTALQFSGNRHMGKITGSGMGTAIILQFVIQNLTPQSIYFTTSIILGTMFLILLLIRTPKERFPEDPLPSDSDIRTGHKTAVILITAVILMSLVAGMIDSVLTSFNAENAFDIYSGVRLFYALGLILAGVIADIRDRSYLPLTTVCTILLSSICMFFLSDEVSYFAGTALMYLYSGFYVIFFTVMFLDFAPKSRHPELWAGMGRIVRSLTVAAAVLPSLKIYNAVGSTALAVGSCLISIGILLVLLPYICRAVTVSEENKDLSGHQELSPHERLEQYAQHCSLTPRETDVLEMLLTTDDDLQGIADNLYISRRMVQRHVSSIYEKTETKTRLGLFQNYIKFTAN